MSETRCRSCDSAELTTVLSLGHTPLANSLLDEDELSGTEPSYPLDLAFCPGCSLVQIVHTVPPEALFRDYVYFSSYSDTVLENARAIAERLVAERRLDERSLAIDIASNDGYLLRFYRQAGVRVLGVEPAGNVAQVAVEEHGIPTVSEFFGDSLAETIVRDGTLADVVHANNVLAHVADLNGFVRGLRTVMKSDALAVIEVPYVRDMIDGCEFDTIYHEHLCYFSLTALVALFERHGLTLVDVEHLRIHGGSLRVFVTRAGDVGPSQRVEDMMAVESQLGVDALPYYLHFGERVSGVRDELRKLLAQLRAEGGRMAAYGAAAKGSTLLNYCGVGLETIEFVADRNIHKQGKYMPGSHLPIVSPAKILETMPDYLLLLAWNHADEIREQQREYLSRGGSFVVPIPSPQVV